MIWALLLLAFSFDYVIYEQQNSSLIERMRIQYEGDFILYSTDHSGYLILSSNKIFVPALFISPIFSVDYVRIGLNVTDYNDFNENDNYSLYVGGDAFSIEGWDTYSDVRHKKNVRKASPVLGKILLLSGKKYTVNGKKKIGFIAEEVENILPEVTGKNSILPSSFISALIKAYQEQERLIEKQKKRIEELRVKGCFS